MRNVSILVAIGVSADGYRRVLGVAEAAKEDKAGWLSFLKHLKERSLAGTDLIVSDACPGHRTRHQRLELARDPQHLHVLDHHATDRCGVIGVVLLHPDFHAGVDLRDRLTLLT